jgi:hypothetical protein
LHSEKFEFGLIGGDAVEDKSALSVVQKTEVLVRLFERDDILEAGGVVDVTADLVINLDKSSHDNHNSLAAGQSVFQTVTKNEDEGETLAQFVGTSGGMGSPGASHLVKHPVLRRMEALQMLFGATSHVGQTSLEEERGFLTFCVEAEAKS